MFGCLTHTMCQVAGRRSPVKVSSSEPLQPKPLSVIGQISVCMAGKVSLIVTSQVTLRTTTPATLWSEQVFFDLAGKRARLARYGVWERCEWKLYELYLF